MADNATMVVHSAQHGARRPRRAGRASSDSERRALAKAHARTSRASIAPVRPGFAVLHADGGAREDLHLAAIGYEIRGADGLVRASHGELIGRAGATAAEYRALLAGLERAHRLGLDHVDARSDARLVVEHLHGEREVKNAHLVTLRAEILELTARIGTVVFTWIPAEANGRAHALVAQALTRGGGGGIVAP